MSECERDPCTSDVNGDFSLSRSCHPLFYFCEHEIITACTKIQHSVWSATDRQRREISIQLPRSVIDAAGKEWLEI